MVDSEILSSLMDLVADIAILDSSEVTEFKTIQDLGLDSIDVLDIAMEIEEEFDIEISDSNMKEYSEKTLRELATFITEKKRGD